MKPVSVSIQKCIVNEMYHSLDKTKLQNIRRLRGYDKEIR